MEYDDAPDYEDEDDAAQLAMALAASRQMYEEHQNTRTATARSLADAEAMQQEWGLDPPDAVRQYTLAQQALRDRRSQPVVHIIDFSWEQANGWGWKFDEWVRPTYDRNDAALLLGTSVRRWLVSVAKTAEQMLGVVSIATRINRDMETELPWNGQIVQMAANDARAIDHLATGLSRHMRDGRDRRGAQALAKYLWNNEWLSDELRAFNPPPLLWMWLHRASDYSADIHVDREMDRITAGVDHMFKADCDGYRNLKRGRLMPCESIWDSVPYVGYLPEPGRAPVGRLYTFTPDGKDLKIEVDDPETSNGAAFVAFMVTWMDRAYGLAEAQAEERGAAAAAAPAAPPRRVPSTVAPTGPPPVAPAPRGWATPSSWFDSTERRRKRD